MGIDLRSAAVDRRFVTLVLRRGALLGLVALLVAIVSGFGARGSRQPPGKIVFAARAHLGGGSDIYSVNADGTRLRRLTTSSAEEDNPTWSPNGRSIAYVRGRSLYRMAANGMKPRLLWTADARFQSRIFDAAWSPDGRRVAFSAVMNSSAVWTYEFNGRLMQVTQRPSGDPSWSPDGKRLAYTGSDGGKSSIFVIGADGGGDHDVSHATVTDQSPVWSPNGRWIALRSLNADWRTHEVDSLDIISPDGTSRRTLTTGGAIFPAAWSPRSDAVLFLRVANPEQGAVSSRQLYIVSVKGGTPRPVPGTNGALGGASWHR
jgi:Tol biopolymer transport system component